ncbi:MAG: hypothetical protein ACXAC8_08575 [Candidatus Hodarchaeales archaeon]
MSQFVTGEVEDQIRGVRVAKHVVIRSILKEHLDPDTEEHIINGLLMRIYQLFYDSSMVDSLFSDIQERERQKEELQEMELEDIAKLAFGEVSGETSDIEAETDFASLLEADESMFESMVALSDQLPYEEIYNILKEANIHIIIDFFSAFQGSTSSLLETTSELSDVDKKNVLDIFSLFVEKQMETESEEKIGKDLGTALTIDIADSTYYIFMYAPKKWLDTGMTQRLSIGLMIKEDWVKYISIMSTHIAKRLTEITDMIIGTSSDELSNISFRLVDLSFRKNLKTKMKKVAEYIARCSLAWDQIQSSTTL